MIAFNFKTDVGKMIAVNVLIHNQNHLDDDDYMSESNQRQGSKT